LPANAQNALATCGRVKIRPQAGSYKCGRRNHCAVISNAL